MANPAIQIKNVLDDLRRDDLRDFQDYLLQPGLGFTPLRTSQVEDASTLRTANTMVEAFTTEAVNVAAMILGSKDYMNKGNLAARLKPATSGSAGRSGSGQWTPPADPLDFIKRNRGNLVGQVLTIDAVLDDLVEVYHDELLDNVKSQTTRRAKIRALLDSTTSDDRAVVLVKALHKHQPDVLNNME